MKRLGLKNFILTLVFFGSSLSAWADMKIAVIDFRQALSTTEVAKSVMKRLEKKTQSDRDKIESLQKELHNLQQRLQKDGAVMSQDEQRKISNVIQEKETERRFYANKVQKASETMEEEFFRTNAPTARRVVRELIEEKGFDLVLNQEAAAHVKAEYDLTKELLARLNKVLK